MRTKKFKKLSFFINALYLLLTLILGFHSHHVNLDSHNIKNINNQSNSISIDPFIDKDSNCVISLYNSSLFLYPLIRFRSGRIVSENLIECSDSFVKLLINHESNQHRAPPVLI